MTGAIERRDAAGADIDPAANTRPVSRHGKRRDSRRRGAADQETHARQPGSRARRLNHSRTCRSIQTAAWFPPATLGFMAAANASAKIPTGAGGEFTHA